MVRTGVGIAMRAMGQQFVLGRDIDEAVNRSRKAVADGYRHSFDMLGEAARTADAAQRYGDAYSGAIARLAKAADARADVFQNPGISVKLSALHPRYESTQRDRVMRELVPRLTDLARQARDANIGFNIDAEEANRLDLSLDVVEAVLRDPALRGWDGFGIVVQAYAKTCLPVLRWFDALVRDIGCRAAVRLVKGAYWDSEIKQAQVLGLSAFPVFTRKTSTDASYLAGARFLLAHDDVLYPQFASHNAHSIAAVVGMATKANRFEFQRLHGMGETLHALVLEQTGRLCRIYAPVGRHEDLLAYLVRRMLENGANSSFVNQLLDPGVPPEQLVADPIGRLHEARTLDNPRIPLPIALFGQARRNSAGLDINQPADAGQLDEAMAPFARQRWQASPEPSAGLAIGAPTTVLNPADQIDEVGEVRPLESSAVPALIARLRAGQLAWQQMPVDDRAQRLERIADCYEANLGELAALLTREAGKIRLDAVAEVREAVDFCRYYAVSARQGLVMPTVMARGVFVCISPWNFPLAIFTGQIVAALVAGNAVAAKPAEQTPLIAARAVELMHEAGIPTDVLALAPGAGSVLGAALVASPDIHGVCFTGSTATATSIDRALAQGNPHAILIAETGGINAMIVDSTALLEAAVRDIVQSAFQSAGQRCSALRVLFVQHDIADELIHMLAGAAAELCVGDPRSAAVDVGPVIDDAAKARINRHCLAMRADGRLLFQAGTPPGPRYVAPVAFRLDHLGELTEEIFGPVLHIIRFAADEIDAVIARINATGYGLTFGLHSRIDARVRHIASRIQAGNIYVNRNQIGAVVGVQPFGGERLSGTGPKAGGPHYLSAFVRQTEPTAAIAALPESPGSISDRLPAVTDLSTLASRLALLATSVRQPGAIDRIARLRTALPSLAQPWQAVAMQCFGQAEALMAEQLLPGPTGESNRLSVSPRGVGLCLGTEASSSSPAALLFGQAIRALSMGNAVWLAGPGAGRVADILMPALQSAGLPADWLMTLSDEAVAHLLATPLPPGGGYAFVCLEGDDPKWGKLRSALARRSGIRIPLLDADTPLARFSLERVVTIDTTASGGNASLLTMAGAEDSVLG